MLIEALVVSGLKDAGYAVATARNAEEAIALLEQADAAVRAIVTDVNLAPDSLTGWDVARRAPRNRRSSSAAIRRNARSRLP